MAKYLISKINERVFLQYFHNDTWISFKTTEIGTVLFNRGVAEIAEREFRH
jgi:hypothetical protein